MIRVIKNCLRKLLRVFKRLPVIIRCNNVYLDCKSKLKKHGFKRIKRFSLLTWKYYGQNFIRITMLAFLDDKKYVLKINKGESQKVKNSISFQKNFNNIFDFIPKGIFIDVYGYDCLAVEYIDAVSFDRVSRSIVSTHLDSLIEQTILILDKFNAYKIVHCDLESVNVLLEKKSNKIFVIDFDTVSGDGFYGGSLPPNTIKRITADGAIYDDAYSFVQLFKRFKVNGIDQNPNFKKLEQLIDRNCIIRKGNR